MEDNGGLDHDKNSRGGEKQFDCGYTLRAKQAGLADMLDVG